MACVCPSCGSGKTQVRDTDSKSYDVSVKRIRQCCDCDRRFETWEGVDQSDIKLDMRALLVQTEKAVGSAIGVRRALDDLHANLRAISE